MWLEMEIIYSRNKYLLGVLLFVKHDEINGDIQMNAIFFTCIEEVTIGVEIFSSLFFIWYFIFFHSFSYPRSIKIPKY